MKKIISIMLSIMIMLMPMISLGTTGHINGCTNTTFDTGCCTKTFRITPQEGYRVIDVIVNGVSQGAITTYTFSNITGPQTLKVVTEAISGSGTGDDTVDPGPFTIRFNANGGTGTMEDQIFEAGVEQNLNTCTFTKTGYYFVGWASTASGDAEYTDGDFYIATANKTLYAVWRQCYSLSLSGVNNNYTIVKINSDSITTTGTHYFVPGDTITVSVKAASSFVDGYIKYLGTTVTTATNGNWGEYSCTPDFSIKVACSTISEEYGSGSFANTYTAGTIIITKQ